MSNEDRVAISWGEDCRRVDLRDVKTRSLVLAMVNLRCTLDINLELRGVSWVCYARAGGRSGLQIQCQQHHRLKKPGYQ